MLKFIRKLIRGWKHMRAGDPREQFMREVHDEAAAVDQRRLNKARSKHLWWE